MSLNLHSPGGLASFRDWGQLVCVGVFMYSVTDAFSFTSKPPVNLQLSETPAAFITNLSFSSQPDGLAEFQSVVHVLSAIKANKASSLQPLAALTAVRNLYWLPNTRCAGGRELSCWNCSTTY